MTTYSVGTVGWVLDTLSRVDQDRLEVFHNDMLSLEKDAPRYIKTTSEKSIPDMVIERETRVRAMLPGVREQTEHSAKTPIMGLYESEWKDLLESLYPSNPDSILGENRATKLEKCIMVSLSILRMCKDFPEVRELDYIMDRKMVEWHVGFIAAQYYLPIQTYIMRSFKRDITWDMRERERLGTYLNEWRELVYKPE